MLTDINGLLSVSLSVITIFTIFERFVGRLFRRSNGQTENEANAWESCIFPTGSSSDHTPKTAVLSKQYYLLFKMFTFFTSSLWSLMVMKVSFCESVKNP